MLRMKYVVAVSDAKDAFFPSCLGAENARLLLVNLSRRAVYCEVLLRGGVIFVA